MTLLILLVATKERSCLLDYYGFGVMASFIVVKYIFYLMPSLKIDHADGPDFAMHLFMFVYLTSCHFMTSNFVLSIVMR